MKTLNFTLLFTIAVALLMISSCKENSVGSEPTDDGEAEIVNEVDVELPTDSGEVGLVINVREITRKGYRPTEAEVDLQAYPGFSETLEIDPVTNVAILSISNEDLSDEQKSAFETGTPVEITIYDENQNILAEYFDNGQVLDDSNEPLILDTDLDYKILPVSLREGVPYFIQPEEPIPGDGNFTEGAVLKASTTRLYTFDIPDTDNVTFHYKYFFSPVTDSTYHILRSSGTVPHEPTYYFRLAGSELIVVDEGVNEESSAIEFVLDQSADGWVRIREAGTDRYLTITEGSSDEGEHSKALRMKENTNHRFRFISANIEWDASDRGTTYHQPVTPPAQLDFAYEATIRNCTSGILTETVGNSETRVSRRTTTTAEKLELFGSVTSSVDVSVGAEVGGDLYGAKATVGVSLGLEVSTSITTSEERTLSKETEVSTEVSRTRSLEIPSFTGVEVYDAVRTVRGAKVPFTQVLRLTAQYTDGPALTGDEIMTQMLFNFVSGVPVSVGQDYVDVGIGGQILIENMYDVETGANELPGACD